jgi:hypothetical protein
MNLAEYRATVKKEANHNRAHTALVKACLAWLAAHKVPAWGMNTGAMEIPATTATRSRLIRFAFPGCSDILGIIPRGHCAGRFLAIECKTGAGTLTDDQGRFQVTVLRAGGAFVVARSLDDMAKVGDLLAE